MDARCASYEQLPELWLLDHHFVHLNTCMSSIIAFVSWARLFNEQCQCLPAVISEMGVSLELYLCSSACRVKLVIVHPGSKYTKTSPSLGFVMLLPGCSDTLCAAGLSS